MTTQHQSDELREILSQANDKIERKLFRYGNRNSHGVKHGINVSDAKSIVRWAAKQSSSQTRAALTSLMEKKQLVRNMDFTNEAVLVSDIQDLLDKLGGET